MAYLMQVIREKKTAAFVIAEVLGWNTLDNRQGLTSPPIGFALTDDPDSVVAQISKRFLVGRAMPAEDEHLPNMESVKSE